MKIYEECYQPVSTLDLTWENSGSLYWLKVEEYFLFVRGLLAEAVWSDWWPQLSPDTSKCFNKIYTLGGGERGGRPGHQNIFQDKKNSDLPTFICARQQTVLSVMAQSVVLTPRVCVGLHPPLSLETLETIKLKSPPAICSEPAPGKGIKLANILDIVLFTHKYGLPIVQFSDRWSMWS